MLTLAGQMLMTIISYFVEGATRMLRLEFTLEAHFEMLITINSYFGSHTLKCKSKSIFVFC